MYCRSLTTGAQWGSLSREQHNAIWNLPRDGRSLQSILRADVALAYPTGENEQQSTGNGNKPVRYYFKRISGETTPFDVFLAIRDTKLWGRFNQDVCCRCATHVM